MCSQNRARSYNIPDPTSCSILVPIFQRRPRWYCAGLIQIWSEWQVRFWSNASCLEASCYARIFGPASFRQNVTSLPLASHFQTWLHSSTDGPDHIVQNQPWSSWVLAEYVGFWPNGAGPEASLSGHRFWIYPLWMWIGAGMFTWLFLGCSICC